MFTLHHLMTAFRNIPTTILQSRFGILGALLIVAMSNIFMMMPSSNGQPTAPQKHISDQLTNPKIGTNKSNRLKRLKNRVRKRMNRIAKRLKSNLSKIKSGIADGSTLLWAIGAILLGALVIYYFFSISFIVGVLAIFGVAFLLYRLIYAIY